MYANRIEWNRPNRFMPAGVVIPVLTYPDVRAAVDWHCHAFGFREQIRIADHRSQLGIGAGSVVVAQGSVNPTVAGWPTHSIMVRVDDADAHHDRAAAYGARVTIPPTTYPFGERQYTAVDIGGHVWTFSQTVADIDPASWEGVTMQSYTDIRRENETSFHSVRRKPCGFSEGAPYAL